MTATILYEGNLRCNAKHLQSGTTIETDAPTDNRGKGERFSPTDTVCTALATCMPPRWRSRYDMNSIERIAQCNKILRVRQKVLKLMYVHSCRDATGKKSTILQIR